MPKPKVKPEDRRTSTDDGKTKGHRYPWETWFRKKEFTLKRGEDFKYTIDIMCRMIRNRNRKNLRYGRLRITLDYENETLTVTCLDKRRK